MYIAILISFIYIFLDLRFQQAMEKVRAQRLEPPQRIITIIKLIRNQPQPLMPLH